MDKTTAVQQACPQNVRFGSASTHAQCARLLERLQRGSADTITARSELNVMQPAARIKELRENGYSIKTHRLTRTDEQGRTHHCVALYFLTQLEA